MAMTERDQWELEWWRHFSTKIEPGGDMPKVGSALLGYRYYVRRSEPLDGSTQAVN